MAHRFARPVVLYDAGSAVNGWTITRDPGGSTSWQRFLNHVLVPGSFRIQRGYIEVSQDNDNDDGWRLQTVNGDGSLNLQRVVNGAAGVALNIDPAGRIKFAGLPEALTGQVMARFAGGAGDWSGQSAPNDGRVLARVDSGGGLGFHFIGTISLENGAVTQAKLGNAAVGQAQLKSTTTESLYGSVGAGVVIQHAFAGGEYSKAWGFTSESINNSDGRVCSITSGGFAMVIGLHNASTGAANFRVKERHIQGSPPYDWGDGEIPGVLFYAALDSLGRWRHLSCGLDAMWDAWGPTPVNSGHPDVVDLPPVYGQDGTLITPAKRHVWLPKNSDGVLDLDLLGPQADLQRSNRDLWECVELTQAIKNRDMGLFPHPFFGNDLTGLTVVMLDPFDPITERLTWHHLNRPTMRVTDPVTGQKVMREMNATALVELGYVRLDNRALNRKGPPGVQIVRPRWKATG